MNAEHMLEIIQNLVSYELKTMRSKTYVKERLFEMGWTEFDLEYFNIAWMFAEE